VLKKLLLLIVLLAIVAALAWYFLKPAETTIVSIVNPQRQSLSTHLDLNAVVVNDQMVTITALLSGQLGSIKVSEGSEVVNNQALALLDNQEAQSLLDKARAELEYRQKKLNSANRTYTRIKSLSNAGNASRQQLDESLDTYRSSESELSVAEASVALAELHLKNATISAPFAGIVTEKFAETGQWVEAGTPLFTLVASDGYLIEAQVDASDWAKVSKDQTVSLTTETAPDHHWESIVSWIAPTVAMNERNARAVAIRFPFGENAPALLLAQEVDVELEMQRVDNALTLPLSVMVETEPGEYAVYLANNDKAIFTSVSVGLQNATHAEITGGLDEDHQVIIPNRIELTDGMTIEIQ